MENNEQKAKKPFYKKWWFWVIVAVVVIGAIASSGDNSNTTTSITNSTEKETSSNPIEYKAVNIDELEDALENNAAAAKDTYNGQYLEITGKLSTIDSDLKYISIVSLTDSFDLIGVHCTIKNNEQKEIIKTLSKGDTVIVKGKITNVGEVLGYYLDITEISK